MRTVPTTWRRLRLLVVVVLVGLTGCGADGGARASAGRPSVVVTTSVLGDVVSRLVGEAADVEVLMAPGADPHEFALSARQGVALREADIVVSNGGGLEAGLVDALEAAERDGAAVLATVDLVGPDADSHFFTDPNLMATAVGALGDELAEHLEGIDAAALRRRVATYEADLAALDAQVEAILARIPPPRRVLVTSHAVLDPFADRYDLEVLGSVVPGGSTLATPGAADLDGLADLVDAEAVPAVFVESGGAHRLAEALADEAGGDVEVVELFTESLGPDGSAASTYVGMVRTNARRIADALAP